MANFDKMNKTKQVKHIKNLQQIVAGDACFLKEIFHPDRDPVKTHHSLAYAFVEPGGKTLNHYLEKQSETYYIIKGKGMMHIDDESFEVETGNSYIVPPKGKQWLENLGEDRLEFLVIVDTPWKLEDEVVVEEG